MPAPAAQRLHPLDEAGVDLADAAEDREEDQHRDQDEAERHLRADVDAEPDDEERREDHPRDRVQEDHHRLEHVGERRDHRRREAEQRAEDEPAGEPEQRRGEGGGDVLPDRAVGEELGRASGRPCSAAARRTGRSARPGCRPPRAASSAGQRQHLPRPGTLEHAAHRGPAGGVDLERQVVPDPLAGAARSSDRRGRRSGCAAARCPPDSGRAMRARGPRDSR